MKNVFYLSWIGDHNPQVEADHQFVVPFAACPVCNGGARNYEYPSVDISSYLTGEQVRLCSPSNMGRVSWSGFEAMRESILKGLQREIMIAPATEFGASMGKFLGKKQDFAWANIGRLFISSEALTKLEEHLGIRITVSAARLSARKGVSVEMFEIEAPPYGKLSEKSFDEPDPKRCVKCSGWLPKRTRMVLNSSSLPDDAMVFRLIDRPSVVLCNQLFADAVASLRFSNIKTEKAVCDGV